VAGGYFVDELVGILVVLERKYHATVVIDWFWGV
jgi:hypothetical protein